MQAEFDHEVIYTNYSAEKSFSGDKANTGRVFIKKTHSLGKLPIKKDVVLELAGPNTSSPERKFATFAKLLTMSDAARIGSAALHVARVVEDVRPVPGTRPYVEFVTDVIDNVRLGACSTNNSEMSYFIEASDDGRTLRCPIGKVEDLHELMDLCVRASNY